MSYTLILSEKREAAERIAKALDDEGRPKHLKEQSVPYFEAVHKGKRIVVVPAIGHLYTVAPEVEGQFYYPVFNVVWKPASSGGRSGRIKSWIEAISNIARDASDFISATDYDIEGEVIGYTILKYVCGNREGQARRMIFSTLTTSELRNAFDNPSPNIDFRLAEAGESRHMVDFLWGVNLSRALTLATKNWSKRYTVLSTGRVQAPTLNFLVDREKEIRSFVPIPYWAIHPKVKINRKFYEAEYEKSGIESEAEAKRIVEECSRKEGLVEDVETRVFNQSPPTPFDLGALQTEAYRLFGYTPSRTLSIAERLYLDALISYPRTSSQKIPPQVNYREILTSLGKSRTYAELTSELLRNKELKPNEGKRDDPAHPAVYPTGNLPQDTVDPSQRRVFDLVVKRFMAVFSSPAVKEGMKISLEVGGNRFYLHGRRVLDEGWLRFYKPYSMSDEVILPHLERGEKIIFAEITCEEKYTPPPPRYNPASLLKLMEEKNLGTKATRSEIIDTLFDRGYIHDERMVVSELGFNVIETLEEYSPAIISTEFTTNLEEKMERIENGKGRKEEVLEDAVDRLRMILEELKNMEGAIGEALGNAVRRARLEDLIIGQCPTCKTGSLIIIHSKKTGKRFVGCTNFAKDLCKTTLPLPQPPYLVKPLRKVCYRCQWPIVMVRSRRRRQWRLCLNPNCPTKEEYRRRAK